jgi:diguanylate cyclase (GGDEF)-like protein/PAS domain S-box-containing protein
LRSGRDGLLRTYAYRQVGRYPLLVQVGTPLPEFPGSWGHQEKLVLVLALVCNGLGGLLLVRLRRSGRQAVDTVRRRYEAMVESSGDAIIAQSLNGRVLSWNRAAEEMFGYSAAEMADQPLLSLLPPERLDEDAQLLARVVSGETLEQFQTERLCKDGRRITVSVSLSPIRDAGGRVVGASKICRNISRQRAQEEEIRHLAYFDGLTDLPNRRLLLDRLQHAVELSRRTSNGAALLYVDLDGLRQLNEQHGHEIGDLCLKHAARTIQGRVRSSDTVARLGGDEFVVLCENLGPDHARAREIAHMLAQSIEQLLARPCDLDGLIYGGGASVGIQVFIGGAQSAQELLQRAGAAMRQRKTERLDSQRGAATAAGA